METKLVGTVPLHLTTPQEMQVILLSLIDEGREVSEEEWLDDTEDYECYVEGISSVVVIVCPGKERKYRTFILQIPLEDFMNVLQGGDFD